MQRDFLTMYNKIAIDKGKYRYNRKAINRTENTLFQITLFLNNTIIYIKAL